MCRVNGELDVGLGGFWAELAKTAALSAVTILPAAGLILCGVVCCVRGKKLWCGRRIEQDPEEADPARDRPVSAERIRLEDILEEADEQVINEVAAGDRLNDEQGVDEVNVSNLEAHHLVARNLIRRSSQASPVDDHVADNIHTNVEARQNRLGLLQQQVDDHLVRVQVQQLEEQLVIDREFAAALDSEHAFQQQVEGVLLPPLPLDQLQYSQPRIFSDRM